MSTVLCVLVSEYNTWKAVCNDWSHAKASRSKTSTVGMRTIMVLDNVTLRVSAARCRDSWYLPVLVVVRYHFAGCALGVATLDERLLRH
jgi:hypothetical protein